MIIAAGVFHYFHEEQVIGLIKRLSGFRAVQLVFDTVSRAGIRGSRHYLSKMGRQEAEMFFSVDNARTFAARISPETKLLEERKFYGLAGRNPHLSPGTQFKMRFSDMFSMVK
jgi:O-methyltransferase involved in polyketide biosynthesis